MALMLGELAGVISLNTKPFEQGLDRSKKKFEDTAKSTEQTADKMRAAVEAASKKVADARKREEDAAGAVRVAEARLEDARKKGNPTAVLVASENLAKAQRNFKGAADAAKAAQEGLTEQEGKLKESLERSKGNLKDFGAKGALIAAAAGAAIGAALVAGIANAMNFEKVTDKLAAQLGLNAEESEKAGGIAGSLYAGAYGSSMEEVTGAVGAVMSSIDGMRTASEADVEAMTAKVLDLAAAFEIDAGRAAQVAGQMVTSGLAEDGVEAVDLLTASLQKVPAAVREDLLDAVDEYGPFMETLGITGEKAMGLLVTASEKGMYGIDKTGDALKEFGIRATDMSKTSGDAYETLGLDQQDMTNKLLAGGDDAAEAFQTIVDGLQGIKDPAERSQAALALFGTPLEDLSVTDIPKFLDSLDTAEGGLGDVAGAADAMGDTLNDNAATNIETFKRGLEMGITDVLNNNVIPAINDAVKWINTSFIPALQGAAKWILEVRVPLGIISTLILTVMIPHWVALATAATVSAAKQAAAWVVTQVAAGKAAIKHSGAVVVMIAGWALLGTQAMIHATKTAAAWLIALGPVGWAIGIIALLVGAFVWAYHNIGWFKDGVDAAFRWVGAVVGEVFAGIQQVIGVVVAWFTDTVVPGFQAAVDGVGQVFNWLYTNIIKPVFDSISTIVGGFYLFFRGIFQLVTSIIQNIVIPLFMGFWHRMVEAFNGVGEKINWFWNSIVKPVFGFIGTLISNWWKNTVLPVFNAVSNFLKVTLGPVFDWLWKNAIKPAFDGIGSVIKFVWEKVIKPVFDTISTFITKTIPDAFNKGIGFIKTHWQKLQDIVKAPVKFVIERVINDGLIGAFNTIAGILPGIDKLPKVALPEGFRDGGYTGNKPKGAVAGVVHGDEHVIRSESRRRIERTNPGLLDHMNRTGSMAGYANGGRVAPLKHLAVTQGYNRVHKGIDYAAAEGTPVFATQGGVVNHAGPGARAPGVWGGNEIHIAGSGLETWFAHLSRIGVGMGQRVRAGQQIGLSGNTGISSGPHLHFGVFNGGWPNDIDPGAYLGGAGVPSGGAGGGFNPIAGIIDGLVSKFKEQFPGGGIFADMAIGIGKKILDGASKWVTDTIGGKDRKGNAAGPTVYDGGGWLENTGGPQLVQHNKSKPDAVLSDQQWADIHKLALGSAAGGVNYSPTIQYMGEDPETLLRRDKARFVDLLNSTAPAY